MMTFEEEKLPERVFLGYMSYYVREYTPKPLRCYNCQRFGHTAPNCRGKRRCSRCGEDHEYMQCKKETQPNCCNCEREIGRVIVLQL